MPQSKQAFLSVFKCQLVLKEKSPPHTHTHSCNVSLFSANAAHDPPRSIISHVKYLTGQCYASSVVCFYKNSCYMLSERLFRLVGDAKIHLLIFHPEHHVIIFSSRIFFGCHISRIISLQAYHGTKSVGLQDWDIALFILHLRCWYGDLVSHHALEQCIFSLTLHDLCLWNVSILLWLCFLYPCHVQIGLFPKPKVYICLFSLTVKKNLIFNFNQCYFTYCRDSNLCDFRQPKYCSVQFCSCVWTVSVHSQQSWEFCIHLFSQEKSVTQQ